MREVAGSETQSSRRNSGGRRLILKALAGNTILNSVFR